MNQQVVLNIFNIPTRIEIQYAKNTSRTYHYCFGMISVRMNPSKSLKQLQKDIEKVFKPEKIARLNSEPLFHEDQAYVFGDLVTTIRKIGDPLDVKHVKVTLLSGKKITLHKLLIETLVSRVRYYEKIMGLATHEVKVKNLISILGNNHYKQKVLNFNEKLIHFSLELIDSVVIHELCHDFYQDHSRNFYNKLLRYCPDYYQKREKLVYGVRK